MIKKLKKAFSILTILLLLFPYAGVMRVAAVDIVDGLKQEETVTSESSAAENQSTQSSSEAKEKESQTDTNTPHKKESATTVLEYANSELTFKAEVPKKQVTDQTSIRLESQSLQEQAEIARHLAAMKKI